MSKCSNCCYGVMTGPNRMFCSAQNCVCEEVVWCEDYEPIVKPLINVDRFRAMTDEELAAYIDEHTADAIWCNNPPFDCPTDEKCVDCILNWLRREATE